MTGLLKSNARYLSKGSAIPGIAFRPDLPLVPFNDLSAEIKSDPKSRDEIAGSHPVIPIKNVTQIFWFDADVLGRQVIHVQVIIPGAPTVAGKWSGQRD